MKARGGLSILVCALAALCAVADAKPNYIIKPKGLHLSASLTASNGYAASIQTSGHRQVVLTLFQGSYLIQYRTLGKVTRSGISADFGRLGRVSLRFRGNRHPRKLGAPFLLRECKGRKAVAERGVLLGNVRFRGERGFTRIKAQRVKGSLVRSYRRICKGPAWLRAGASSADEFESYVLSAVARVDGSKRSFIVEEGGAIGLAIDVATLEEKVDGVAIAKTAFALDESVFHLSPPGKNPVETKLVPTWPFVGSAFYLAEAKQPPTWTGSLGVRFPGSGQVSLAGPEFEAELCRATSSSRFVRCQETIESLRPFAQGSGSHSQPLALARLSWSR